jgi:hypothetical protein
MKRDKEQMQLNHEESPGMLQVLGDPKYRNCTFILIVFAIFNQLSGVNAINIYSYDLLSSA